MALNFLKKFYYLGASERQDTFSMVSVIYKILFGLLYNKVANNGKIIRETEILKNPLFYNYIKIVMITEFNLIIDMN